MSQPEKRRFVTPILVIVALAGVSLFYVVSESNTDTSYIGTVDEKNRTIFSESDHKLEFIENELQIPSKESQKEVVSSNQTITDNSILEKVEYTTSVSTDAAPVSPPVEAPFEALSPPVEAPFETLSPPVEALSRAVSPAVEAPPTAVSPPVEAPSELVNSVDVLADNPPLDIPPVSTDSNNIPNMTVLAWDGVSGMNSIVSRYWKGNLFCETIDQTRSGAEDPNLPIHVKITFGCKELYEKSELGTGNFIALLYGFRLAAHVYGNVELSILCDDAEDTKKDLILPWITGSFPLRPLDEPSYINITIQEACGSYASQPLAYMYHEIQHDLRKMAVGLMGIPSEDHPSAGFAKQYLYEENLIPTLPTTRGRLVLSNPRPDDIPPFPSSDYELDDAVLHFRCGDLMSSKHPSFAFMKFSGYTKHISPDAKTIGIITQPFDDDTQSRAADSGSVKRNRCRSVVYSLVEYIKVHYPNAEVRVHNAVGETIALTFARMIMSNQAIAGISSFGVIPAIATFGTGYIRQPDYAKAPNQWLLHPRIDELTNNVVLFVEPNRIMVGQMKGLWESKGEQGVLEWFWNDTVQVRTFI